MDLAGMAVHPNRAAWLEPHQLRPAVRGKAQRAERLARPGRNPRHAVSVDGPGRFEGQAAHGFLRWTALRTGYEWRPRCAGWRTWAPTARGRRPAPAREMVRPS